MDVKLSEKQDLPQQNIDHRRLILDTPFSVKSTVSYGLIVYAQNTKRWVLIQRKHSAEFLLFIRGYYRISYLPLLLCNITQEECHIILQCLQKGPSFFIDLYKDVLGLDADGISYALIRMAESRDIIYDILSKLSFEDNTLSWTWPKGRIQFSDEKETSFECAKREFYEEVGIQLPPAVYISQEYITHTIKTLSGRIIESRYWIYIIPEEIPLSKPQCNPEVITREWVSISDTYSLSCIDTQLIQNVVDMLRC